MSTRYRCLMLACAASVCGCSAIIPDVPSDYMLPVGEILLQTSCELQFAFRALDVNEYRRFHANRWLVTIALTPKVDTDLNVSGGFTRKNPFVGNPLSFVTWAVSGPGLQADAKGERTSGVSFSFNSGKLMADNKMRCDFRTPSAHALAQYLGVGSWLRRTAEAILVAPSADVDKPSYNTDITIKFAANGSYTYTFPPGTNLASAGGSYTVDEQLNISMVAIDEKKSISAVTLPSGTNFVDQTETSRLVSSTATPEVAKTRTDTMQLEQAIRSLKNSLPSQ